MARKGVSGLDATHHVREPGRLTAAGERNNRYCQRASQKLAIIIHLTRARTCQRSRVVEHSIRRDLRFYSRIPTRPLGSSRTFLRQLDELLTPEKPTGGVAGVHFEIDLADRRASDKWALNGCWPGAIVHRPAAGHESA